MSEPASALLQLVVDSREQRPYDFDPSRVAVTVACLKSGDYSVLGCEHRVAIERKSLSDYVGSITSERARFVRELERLRRYEFAAVVVEASVADLALGSYRSQAAPASVLGTTWALCCRYVPVLFAGDRARAQMVTEGLLRRWWLDDELAKSVTRLAAQQAEQSQQRKGSTS